MKDFNLQPYVQSGDTSGRRTVAWFKEHVIDRNADFFNGGDALDIGCGNGRFNPITSKAFSSVLGIDPICDQDKRFYAKNVVHCKMDIETFSKINLTTFDKIMFFGSWNIIWINIGANMYDILYKTLRDDGQILITHEDYSEYPLDDRFIVKNQYNSDKTTVKILEKKKWR